MIQSERARAVEKARRSIAPEPFDVLVTVLLGTLLAVALAVGGPRQDNLWLLLLASTITVVPLLWRTRAPVVVLVLVTAIPLVTFAALDGRLIPNIEYLWIPMLVALGAVAARRPLWVSLVALVAVYVVTAAAMIVGFPSYDIGWPLTLSALMCGPAWMLGVFAHGIRSRVERLEAEREATETAVRVERQEIASGIEGVIQRAVRRMRTETDAARRSMAADAAATTSSLTTVEGEGVEAMQELRRFIRRLDAETDHRTRWASEPGTAGRKGTIHRRLAVDRTDLFVVLLAILGTIVMTAFLGGGITLAVMVFIPFLIALLWRNQFPILVFVVIAAAYAGVVVLFNHGNFVWDSSIPIVGLLVAMAAVAGGTPIWCSIPVALLTWAYLSLPNLAYPWVLAENLASYAVFVAAVWVAGYFGGRRRRRIARLQQDHQAAVTRVRTEHAQLAHDLHDVIGHSITAMVLQAAGARRILPQDPARARAALDAIDAAGADALRELNQLVELLRYAPESPDTPFLAPAKGLAQVYDLVERTRSGVAAIDMQVRGIPSQLRTDIDATAFAVVREALANAEKHSGEATRIALTLAWETDSLRVEVTNTYDPGASGGAPDLSGNYGLTSLRARVHDVGGEMSWMASGGVFRVDARLPRAAILARTPHVG